MIVICIMSKQRSGKGLGRAVDVTRNGWGQKNAATLEHLIKLHFQYEKARMLLRA